MYIAHEPSPSFIEKEINRIKKRITAIQEAAHDACEGVSKEETIKSIIKDLYKKYNMPHLQDQLANLKFYKENVLQHNRS